jgi:hypothetical protein
VQFTHICKGFFQAGESLENFSNLLLCRLHRYNLMRFSTGLFTKMKSEQPEAFFHEKHLTREAKFIFSGINWFYFKATSLVSVFVSTLTVSSISEK